LKKNELIDLMQNESFVSFNKKHKNGCGDCEEDQPNPFPLKERIWEGLVTQKKILINGDMDESLIEKAVMQIFQMNEYDINMESKEVGYTPDPIKIFINSSGGTLDEAFSLVSAIEASRTPVVTIVLGKAYSAAFLVLLAGHARFAQARATLMYHQGSAGIGGEFSKIIEYAKHWEKCQGIMDEYVIKKTKIKRKQLNSIFNNRTDSYMNTEMALQLGVIDGIWKF
jgi:ATP-dependent Clp protease protease subunit